MKKQIKKVAIVIPSLVVGGAENMVAQLASAIDKTRFNVQLLVMSERKGTPIDKKVQDENVKVIYFQKPQGFSFWTLLKVYKHLNYFRPDIIHTNLSACSYVIPWALINGVKIIHTIHNIPCKEAIPKILKVLLRLLYKLKKVVPVAISDIIANETISYYNLKSAEVETIYNPVDLSLYDVESKNSKEDEYVKFVNVARFTKVKNQATLVEAISIISKKYKNIKMLLIGDGELRAEVEAMVDNYNLKDVITFTGNISNVYEKLKQSDIFVLSSHYEGLPLSILEAMAAGLPIIATNVGGVPDVVTDNGILVEDNNLSQLVEAMVKLIENKELRLRMGEASRKNVMRFDIKEIANQYQKLYEKYAL